MNIVETKSIVKVIKITDKDNNEHYITLHYDQEFKGWDGHITISYHGADESSVIKGITEQCKSISAIPLKLLDINNTSD